MRLVVGEWLSLSLAPAAGNDRQEETMFFAILRQSSPCAKTSHPPTNKQRENPLPSCEDDLASSRLAKPNPSFCNPLPNNPPNGQGLAMGDRQGKEEGSPPPKFPFPASCKVGKLCPQDNPAPCALFSLEPTLFLQICKTQKLGKPSQQPSPPPLPSSFKEQKTPSQNFVSPIVGKARP